MIRGSRSTELAFIMFFNIRLLSAGFALHLMAKDVSIVSDIITQNGYSLTLTDDLVKY
jgi:3-hydroxyisobutyrate dehydrogenase-like beta-hydroxyacid dehydrogenase